MMRVLGLVAALLACASALYEEHGDVTEFTASADFEKAVVEDDSSLWLVHFYAGPSSEAADTTSATMVEDFAEAAKELAASLGARMAAVDVGLAGNEKAARRFGIQRVPSVLGFGGPATKNPYTGKIDRTPARFEGASFAKNALKRFLTAKVMGDVVRRVDTEAALASVSGPVAVLLTERSTTSALAKSLGVALRGRMSVLEVLVDSDDPSELADALVADDSVALPRLVAAASAASAADLANVYDGDAKDRVSVLSFLERYASKEKAAPEKTGAAVKEEAKGWPSDYKRRTVSNDADLEAFVTKNAAAVLAHKKSAKSDSVAGKVLDFDGSGLLEAVAVDCAAMGPSAGDHLKRICSGSADFYAYPAGASNTKALVSGSDAAKVLDKAIESIPADGVQFIGSSHDMDAFIRRAIMAGEDETAVGIAVFSSKTEIAPSVRALGASLAEAGVPVCHYADPPAEALQAYGIRKVPAIVAFYPQEPDANTPADQRAIGAAQYARNRFGPPTYASLLMFSLEVLAQIAAPRAAALKSAVQSRSLKTSWEKKARERASEDPTKPAPRSAGPVFADLNDPAAWALACGPEAGTSLCAVALLDEHGSSSFKADVATAEAVAKGEQPSPFAFGWVDGACRPDLAAAFDVYGSALPTIVALAPKKNRYAALVGKYAEKDIKSFLRGVLSGRVATTDLRAPLDAPVAADCAAVHAANVAPVAEEDDLEDDFLAELLAEEAAARKALEEEAAAESKRLKEEMKAKKAKVGAPDGAPPQAKKKKRKKKKKGSKEL